MENFKDRLFYLRNNVLSLGMRDFAEKTGVTVGAISQYENGKSKPGSDFIIAISDKFGVSANWLLLNLDPIYLSDIKQTPNQIDTAKLRVKKYAELEEDVKRVESLLSDMKAKYKRL